ncbi:MAG: double-strand break repair protein AddB, partial [Proteobacteria bacterium]|nr:double-strand break repair protein AddB [Pseudomonadota bacterium]
RAGIDLADRLPDAADAQFAAHWNETLRFLEIVTRAWPAILAEAGLSNPAARQVALLEAQARAWEDTPPPDPVWVAGVVSGMPAAARLLRAVARAPQGRVILHGLDQALDDAAWAALEETHPQAGLRALLGALGARRGDVADFCPSARREEERARLLRQALLPAAALGAWQDGTRPGTDGLWRLAPADQQEEALAIALVLRDALETPGARAALVTPDRALAGRVAAELRRFGVVADDSAGEPLSDTPPAVFLRLLAAAIAEGLAPVPLLALLKHPLAAAGLSPAACRRAARALERACLRGPRPAPGLAGLRRALRDVKDEEAHGLLARMEAALEPALRMDAAAAAPPAEALAALVEAAEALAATDAESGPARLWAQEEGEALAARLAEALAALPTLPDLRRGDLPGLLDALLDGGVVRGRRALRAEGGDAASAEHPRVFIWGLLEARLQAVDVMVLGGLAETVWPPAVDPGPWLSRPMREKVGLASPEEAIGQAAHDFVACAMAAPTVVLSCPRRRDGAPAVPARWLARIDAYLGKPGLPEHPAAAWASRLDQPEGAPRPVEPPAPCPPVELRPRRLSVTEIETWQRDPYGIHAKHILRLRKLDPLDQSTEASDYGNVVHDGIHAFLHAVGAEWPDDAPARLTAAMLGELERAEVRPALRAWWRPRIERIAAWVTAREAQRRAAGAPASVLSELEGQWRIMARDFALTGRADRIELAADGTLAILDYKTGSLPSMKDVADSYAPQLPLEAAMARAGAFPGVPAGSETASLLYWRLTGGHEAGKEVPIAPKDRTLADLVDAAVARLDALIRRYDDPATRYLSQPRPDRAPRFSDYAQLARVAEWAGPDEPAADDAPANGGENGAEGGDA